MVKHARQARRPYAGLVAPTIVALITFAAFLPALRNGFVSWDDDRNFLDNPFYRGLGMSQLRWMWTTFHLGHYVPVSWMTLGLDYTIWGMNPTGYHLTNLVLHVGVALLVYAVACRLIEMATADSVDERSATIAAVIAALFFSIHPLRVESVAWVTERRDILCGVFYTLSLLLYLRRGAYWLSVAAFVIALLSKATAVTLPVVLLIVNVYPLRRLTFAADDSQRRKHVMLEIAPFAVLALAAGLMSLVALHVQRQLSWIAKLSISAYSLCFYVWKTIVPTGLAPLYEMPASLDPFAARFIISFVGIIVIALAIVWMLKRSPALATGAVAFVIVLSPLLGIVQNGPQVAADRYTYNAALVFSLYLALALARVAPARRRLLGGVAVVALGAFAVLTWRQTLYWRDSATLWRRVMAVDDNSAIAHNNLGILSTKDDRWSEAIEDYRRAVAINPRYADARINLGSALTRLGDYNSAIDQFREVLVIEPRNADAHYNWGVASDKRGDAASAIEHYEAAISLNPAAPRAHINLGNELVRVGRIDEGINHYRLALGVDPGNADIHHNWGAALAQLGRFTEAIEHFQKAISINPNRPLTREYLDRASLLLRNQTRPTPAPR